MLKCPSQKLKSLQSSGALEHQWTTKAILPGNITLYIVLTVMVCEAFVAKEDQKSQI